MNLFPESAKKTAYPVIITLCVVHFILGLDINIVNISLPSLASQFNVNAGKVTMIVWVYFLVLTGFLMTFGKLGDLKGYKKIYTAGIIIFTAGSFLCGLANDFSMLIIFRVIQATGGAVLFALTPAIISSYVPASYSGKAFGINYMFTALGGVVGRGLSGYIIQMFGWNSIFFLNVPAGLIALILVIYFIPSKQITSTEKKFDIAGSALIFISLFSLLYALNIAPEQGWTSGIIISCFSVSVIFLVLFIFRESKINYALFDLSLLKNRQLILSIFAFMLVYIITNGIIFIFPFYLQWSRNISKEETGLIMLIPSVMQIISGYLSGHFSDKRGSRDVCIAGIIITVISFGFFLFLDSNSPMPLIIASVVLYGFSIGLFIPSNTNRVMLFAGDGKKGSVSSLMITVIRAGSAFGVSFFGVIFSAFVPQKNPVQEQVPVNIINTGFKYAFLFGLIVALTGLIVSLLIKNNFNNEISQNA